MDYINTIRDGKKYKIPYNQLSDFLADGGKFASTQDKEMAMQLEKSQKPGFWGRLGKDVVSGGAGLVRNVGGYGLAGVKSIEDLGDMVSQVAKEAGMPPMQPQDDSPPYSQQGQQLLNKLIPQDYSKQYGPEQPNLMDRLLQGGITHAPELAGGAALLRSGWRALPPLRQKTAAKKLQKAQRGFEKAESEGNLLDMSIDEDLLAQGREYMPSGPSTDEMIKGSLRGEYPSSFAAQSQVGTHQRELARSPLPADRLRSRSAGELKQNMLQDLAAKARSQGLNEEADLLLEGINDYKRYAHVRDKVFPVLRKIGIPTSTLGAASMLLGYGIKKGKDLAS